MTVLVFNWCLELNVSIFLDNLDRCHNFFLHLFLDATVFLWCITQSIVLETMLLLWSVAATVSSFNIASASSCCDVSSASSLCFCVAAVASSFVSVNVEFWHRCPHSLAMYCIKDFLRKVYRCDQHDNSTIIAFLVKAIWMSRGDLQFISYIETLPGQELVSVDLPVKPVWNCVKSVVVDWFLFHRLFFQFRMLLHFSLFPLVFFSFSILKVTCSGSWAFSVRLWREYSFWCWFLLWSSLLLSYRGHHFDIFCCPSIRCCRSSLFVSFVFSSSVKTVHCGHWAILLISCDRPASNNARLSWDCDRAPGCSPRWRDTCAHG